MKKIFIFLLLGINLVANGQKNIVEELKLLYKNGKFDLVIEKARNYQAIDSNNIDVNLLLGRSLTDIGNYTQAIPFLNFSINNDIEKSWRSAWAYAYLGTCYYMISKYKLAEESLKLCLDIKATKNSQRYAELRFKRMGFSDFFNEWKTVEKENICYHFQNLSDSLIQAFIASHEIAYQEVNLFFNASLPKKIDFFVWDSRKDAQKVINAQLGFSIPKYCIVHAHIEQTIGHEITHVVSNYTGEINRKSPFITEGTAVYFDFSGVDRKKLIADWVKHRKKIDVKDTWLNWNEYPQNFSYPFSGLFIEAIIQEYGKDKFLKFYTNQTYENAKSIFGDNFDLFIDEFERSIK